jgi:hypothetical protein
MLLKFSDFDLSNGVNSTDFVPTDRKPKYTREINKNRTAVKEGMRLYAAPLLEQREKRVSI